MSNKGCFKKGNTPWNKDKKGLHLNPDTEFKAGLEHTGKNHPSFVDGVQNMTHDCAYLYKSANKRVRRPRKVYEEFIGPIPKGYIVIHKDFNNKNDEPWNLEAISRAENLKRNQKQRRNIYDVPPEYKGKGYPIGSISNKKQK
jgi:hypothetical protein